MVSEEVMIRNKLGLHARASSVFVKTATAFASSIQVNNFTKTANGKSIMSMMMLEASCGTTIELQVQGEDEQEALQTLVALVEQRFGEDE